MQLFCNGEPRMVDAPLSLKQFLSLLGCDRSGVAVAVNDSVIPIARWEFTQLAEADRILVIQAAQGG